jgi:hypothetical protein
MLVHRVPCQSLEAGSHSETGTFVTGCEHEHDRSSHIPPRKLLGGLCGPLAAVFTFLDMPGLPGVSRAEGSWVRGACEVNSAKLEEMRQSRWPRGGRGPVEDRDL